MLVREYIIGNIVKYCESHDNRTKLRGDIRIKCIGMVWFRSLLWLYLLLLPRITLNALVLLISHQIASLFALLPFFPGPLPSFHSGGRRWDLPISCLNTPTRTTIQLFDFILYCVCVEIFPRPPFLWPPAKTILYGRLMFAICRCWLIFYFRRQFMQWHKYRIAQTNIIVYSFRMGRWETHTHTSDETNLMTPNHGM